jgi:UDPglucose--hexose-1-phosphate uridylyltransferase
LHTLPHNFSEQNYRHSYHWHLEICPRTSIPSGFELGSGLHVNTVSPEAAAKQLREIQLQTLTNSVKKAP